MVNHRYYGRGGSVPWMKRSRELTAVPETQTPPYQGFLRETYFAVSALINELGKIHSEERARLRDERNN